MSFRISFYYLSYTKVTIISTVVFGKMENATAQEALDLQEQDLGTLLHTVFDRHWDLVAYSTYAEERVYYRDIASGIVQLHELLRQAGIVRGDKIALLGRNSPQWAVAYLAVISYGAIVVPVSYLLRPKMVYRILQHAEVRGLFLCDHIWEELNEFYLSYLQFIVGFHSWEVFLCKRESLKSWHFKPSILETSSKEELLRLIGACGPHHPDVPVVLNYTTGTVDFPKGVLLPARSLLSNLAYAARVLPLVPQDTVVSYLPFSHIYGQVFDFLYAFVSGAHLHILSNALSLGRISAAFRRYQPRLILLFPALFSRIFKETFPSWWNTSWLHTLLSLSVVGGVLQRFFCKRLNRFFGDNFASVVVGGAHFNPQIEEFLQTIHFRYSMGYGLTESGSLVAYKTMDMGQHLSVGRAIDGVELSIRNQDANGVGNICIRGRNLMLGYYNSLETPPDAVDAQGWFDTGDLGYLDKNLYLYVKGRSVNALSLGGGFRAYPEELESVMNTMPYVQESLLVERRGELVMLVQPLLVGGKHRHLSEARLFLEMERNRERLNRRMDAGVSVARVELQYGAFEMTPKHSVLRQSYHEGEEVEQSSRATLG